MGYGPSGLGFDHLFTKIIRDREYAQRLKIYNYIQDIQESSYKRMVYRGSVGIALEMSVNQGTRVLKIVQSAKKKRT